MNCDLQVWNTKTNSPWSVMTLAGHSGEVRCLHLQANKVRFAARVPDPYWIRIRNTDPDPGD